MQDKFGSSSTFIPSRFNFVISDNTSKTKINNRVGAKKCGLSFKTDLFDIDND